MPTTKDDDGTWRYDCDRSSGCGDEAPFRSTGWATKALAVARGSQHEREHDDLIPTPELAEFRGQEKG